MKTHLLLWLFIGFNTLSAQELEISAGLSGNLFYDLGFNDGNTSSTYTPSLGYRLQVGVEKAEIEGIRIPFRFSFAY
ncbi:MAG: hypothetical protein AAF927_07285, partial [Bacteroidota bacterium]